MSLRTLLGLCAGGVVGMTAASAAHAETTDAKKCWLDSVQGILDGVSKACETYTDVSEKVQAASASASTTSTKATLNDTIIKVCAGEQKLAAAVAKYAAEYKKLTKQSCPTLPKLSLKADPKVCPKGPSDDLGKAAQILWTGWTKACPGFTASVLTPIAAANPLIGGALLVACTKADLIENLAKTSLKLLRVGRQTIPGSDEGATSFEASGKTVAFSDRGWITQSPLTGQTASVTVTRTNKVKTVNATATQAVVKACLADVFNDSKGKPVADYRSCDCQSVDFKKTNDASQLAQTLTFSSLNGRFLYVFIDGKRGDFAYSVKVSVDGH